VEQNPEDPLKQCHDTVEQLLEEKKELAEENEHLRESADSFGELAERLNTALAEERQAASTQAETPIAETSSADSGVKA
jgi:cell division septum initiation protein DivIVA